MVDRLPSRSTVSCQLWPSESVNPTNLKEGDWVEPWDPEDEEDIAACQRKQEFFLGWFGDPIYFGEYPASVRDQLQERLPKFTTEEVALVKGSNDFFGSNHYCTNYIKHLADDPSPEDHLGNVELLPANKAGQYIGPETQSVWLRPYPIGLRKLLNWISDRYGRPTIYITENGTSIKGENDLPVDQILQDDFRAQFFTNYIQAVADARSVDNVDVRGYMAWSLLE
jgi:beta-glucosidase